MTTKTGSRKSRLADQGAATQEPLHLVAAYLDPETENLLCGFSDGKRVECRIDRLGLPRGPRVVYAAVDEFRTGIEFLREDGSRTDCAGDHVLFVTDSAYRARHVTRGTPTLVLAARIAQRLVAIRKRNALSQRDVARRTGMAPPNYARLEKGRHAPSTPTLLRLAGALGCALGDLIGPTRRP